MVKEKYSVGEVERRFLLAELPPGARNPRHIVDLYLDATRLRLRSVDQPGTETDRKLGHKRRLVDSDPTEIQHTSMYLDESEFRVLADLPNRRLVKTRWAIEIDGLDCSIDVFEESLLGLITLEVDVGDSSLFEAFVPPRWAGPEISRMEAFTGGELAGSSFSELGDAMAKASGLST